MGITNSLKTICNKLGNNNKPTYVVMAIATVKGICRPLFTMMDKKENPETKKYTAIREGLTEIIAIPVYWACGELSGKFAHLLAKPKNFMDKKLYKKYKNGFHTSKVMNAYENAKELAENNLPKMNKNLMFIGVCGAALFVIPALCSVAIRPLMNQLQKRNAKKEQAKPVYNYYNQVLPKNGEYKRLSSFSNVPQYGMKVGGV